MKYYIATKLSNHQNHNLCRDLMNKAGHEITYDWTVHGPVFGKGKAEIKRVAQLEMQGVRDADIVIVLSDHSDRYPTGKGTHVEFGMALAWNKDIHMVGDIEILQNAHELTCCFWHLDNVKVHRNVHYLINDLSK